LIPVRHHPQTSIPISRQPGSEIQLAHRYRTIGKIDGAIKLSK
jgi:hypothetical protein